MFYGMKQIIFLVVASFLVFAIVAVAAQNAEAVKPTQNWCPKLGGICKPTKQLCEEYLPPGSKDRCVKTK